MQAYMCNSDGVPLVSAASAKSLPYAVKTYGLQTDALFTIQLSPSATSSRTEVQTRAGIPTPLELGKKLLEAARDGLEDECRNLMAKGAPFTTDWVCTDSSCE